MKNVTKLIRGNYSVKKVEVTNGNGEKSVRAIFFNNDEPDNILVDYSTEVIKTSDFGDQLCHYVPNIKNEFGRFFDCPKDFYEAVLADEADIMTSGNLGIFSSNGHVMRFFDRKVGEIYRQKTIEGWKDAKFAYGIKLRGVGMSAGSYLAENGQLFYDKDDSPLASFDTIEEAEVKLQEIISECNKFLELSEAWDKYEEKLEKDGKTENEIEELYHQSEIYKTRKQIPFSFVSHACILKNYREWNEEPKDFYENGNCLRIVQIVEKK